MWCFCLLFVFDQSLWCFCLLFVSGILCGVFVFCLSLPEPPSQCRFTSTETIRTIRDGEPRTAAPDILTAPERWEPPCSVETVVGRRISFVVFLGEYILLGYFACRCKCGRQCHLCKIVHESEITAAVCTARFDSMLQQIMI